MSKKNKVTEAERLLESLRQVVNGEKHHAVCASVEDTLTGRVRVICKDGCFSLGLNDLELEAVVDSRAAVVGALQILVAQVENLKRELDKAVIRVNRAESKADSELRILARIKRSQRKAKP